MFGIKRRDAKIMELIGVTARLTDEAKLLRKKIKRLEGFKSARYGVIGSCTGYVFAAMEQTLNGFRSQEVISLDNGEYGDEIVEPPAPNVTFSRAMAQRLISECAWLHDQAGKPTSPDMVWMERQGYTAKLSARKNALDAAGIGDS